MTTSAVPAATIDAALHEARVALRMRLNQVINGFADRSDVLLDVVWDDPAVTTPAWFEPRKATVTIQGDIALDGTHPDEVDPTTPAGRAAHPVIVGLCAHEGGHAHSTRWTDAVTDTTPAAVVRAASLLEEPRVEARQLQRRPGDQGHLRAASRHLHLGDRPVDATAVEDRWRAAQAAVLLLGRVDAGVLTDEDTAPVAPLLRDALGKALLHQLRGLWIEAIGLADGDGAGLLDVASRWVQALGIALDADPDAAGTRLPSHGCSSVAPGDADTAREDASDDDTISGGDPLGAALADALADVSEEAARSLRPQPDDDSTSTAEAAEAARAAERHDRAAADAEAERVFRPGHGRGYHRSNPVIGSREPSTDERAAANRVAQVFRAARWRERSLRVVASQTPPGRLDGRTAMLGAAQRVMGLPVTAAPFRQQIRRHTEQPPLTVGIAVDVSGSMSWAAPVLSSVAWVIAQAAHRVGGRSATVTFGQSVTPIVAPGRPPSLVNQFVANDGMEAFIEATRALDGALTLAAGHGARLLVAVTDGHLVGPGQLTEGARLVRRLTGAGVRVLHLALNHADTAPLDGATLAQLDTEGHVLDVIGDAVVKALAATP